MADIIKILVSENKIHIQNSLHTFFSECSAEVDFCEKDGIVLLEKIKSFRPDVVICDVFMRRMDAIDMRSTALEYENPPQLFFIASSFDNENIINSVISAGFDYYFLKPYSPSSVYNRINTMLKKSGPAENNDIEAAVTDILQKFKIPAHIKGYKFHRDAILMAVKNPDILNYMTKQLYPEIAEIHNTTATRVERAMRTAIETAWERADIKELNEYFSYHINNFSRPSNSEFIACISDKIRLKYLLSHSG